MRAQLLYTTPQFRIWAYRVPDAGSNTARTPNLFGRCRLVVLTHAYVYAEACQTDQKKTDDGKRITPGDEIRYFLMEYLHHNRDTGHV
jgi:hypothetical protein